VAFNRELNRSLDAEKPSMSFADMNDLHLIVCRSHNPVGSHGRETAASSTGTFDQVAHSLQRHLIGLLSVGAEFIKHPQYVSRQALDHHALVR
jgi:hypothetical protein